MKYMRNNWLPVLLLSLLLGLVFYFRSFVMTNIFEPITVLLWAVWRIISSVHQSYYWTILIFVCSVVLIRFIPFRRNAARLAYPDEHKLPNRVDDWVRLIKNASNGRDGIEFLRDRFKGLLISIYRVEQSHSMKMDDVVVREAALLPKTVHRYLFPEEKKKDYRSRILAFMPKSFRRWANKRIDNTVMEETLAWMESMMEISNDQ